MINKQVTIKIKLLFFVFLLCTQAIYAQVTGDYRTTTSGSWTTLGIWQTYNGTTWIAATSYPGQSSSPVSNNVTISSGNTANITANLSLVNIMKITINGGTLAITNNNVTLFLPANTKINNLNGGTISVGVPCSSTKVIQIGSVMYSSCSGGSGVYSSFAQLNAVGGSLTAQPAVTPVSILSGQSINLSGSYTGFAGSVPTYSWTATGPGGYTYTSASQNPGSVTLTTPGVYAFRLTVTSVNNGVTVTDYVDTSVIVDIDSDGDLVGNANDLDDDNDGILDAVECGFCTNSSDLFTNGGFELPTGLAFPTGPTAGTYWNATVNQSTVPGWQTTATDGMIEFWRGNTAFTPNYTAAEGTQMVELNANQVSTLYQTFCVPQAGGTITWSVKHRGRASSSTPDVAQVRIGSSLTTYTVVANLSDTNSAWGTYAGTYTIPAGNSGSMYIMFSSVSAAGGDTTIGNLLDDVQISFSQNCADIDGDGIPNSLDLDSDGDGCNDAIEGAGAFTTLTPSSMPGGNSGASYNGLSSAAVTQNLGNTVGNTATTLGVPTIAGTGQAVGQSQNGFKNDCQDSDGDLIPDWQDLDDDNDGILDTSECPTTVNDFIAAFGAGATTDILPSDFSLALNAKNQNVTRDLSAKFGYPANSGAVIVSITNASVHPSTNVWWTKNGEQPSIWKVTGTMSAFLAMGHDLLYYANDSKTFHIYDNADVIPVTVPGLANQTAVAGQWSIIDIQSQKTLNNLNTNNASVENGNWRYINMNFGSKSFGFSTTVASGEPNYGVTVLLECDTDKDGIPNRLDLDSDNDGCTDAVEGDENVTTSQLTTAGGTVTVGTGSTASNQNLGITVNTYGVPTVVNSGGAADIGSDQGQGIGQSSDASKNDCLDSDGDGVANWQDLDDDNDGILDTAENTCTLPGATGGHLFWDLDGQVFPGGLRGNSLTPDVTGTVVSFGPGLSNTTGINVWNFQNVNSTTAAESRANEDYVQFTIPISSSSTKVFEITQWSTFGYSASLGPKVENLSIEIADNAAFNNPSILYNGSNPTVPGTGTFYVTNLAGYQLKRGITYYVRLYIYGSNSSALLDSFGLN